jgi:hypothetical protein
MIISVFGVAGLGVAELGRMFKSLGYSYAVVVADRLIKSELDKNSTKKRIPVIFKGVKTFLKTYKKFRSKTELVGFIIDTPIELSYLNTRTLGVSAANKYIYRFTRLDETMLASEIEDTPINSNLKVEYKPKKLLGQIVAASHGTSALAPLQTHLYTIKDKSKRKTVDTLIKIWLTTTVPTEKTLRLILRVLPQKKTIPLQVLLGSKKFKRLKKAAILLKKDSSKLSALSTKFKVNNFDLRYLVH